jgi:hypothetical protein
MADGHKDKVSTFLQGAGLQIQTISSTPALEGNKRRAIDICEGGKINRLAMKNLIRAAVARNRRLKE